MTKKPEKKTAIYAKIRADVGKKLRILAAQEGMAKAAMLELLIEDGWAKRASSYR